MSWYSKLNRKLFKRQLTIFEFGTVLIGMIAGGSTILTNAGYLSVTTLGARTGSISTISLVFGISLLSLIGIFIFRKQKNIILIGSISILTLLLFVNSYFPLTTVFNPS